jgi:hypothetical protein
MDPHGEFLRFADEMTRRHGAGQPLVQGPWQRVPTGDYRTPDGWFQIHRHQQSGRWRLQRQEGTGWADIGGEYDRRDAAEADAEAVIRREVGL